MPDTSVLEVESLDGYHESQSLEIKLPKNKAVMVVVYEVDPERLNDNFDDWTALDDLKSTMGDVKDMVEQSMIPFEPVLAKVYVPAYTVTETTEYHATVLDFSDDE